MLASTKSSIQQCTRLYKQFAIIPLEPKLAGSGGVVHFLNTSDAFKKIGEITTLPSIMETKQEQRREESTRASINVERLRRCLSLQGVMVDGIEAGDHYLVVFL